MSTIHHLVTITNSGAHADVYETLPAAADKHRRKLNPQQLHRPAIRFSDAEDALRFAEGREDCTVNDLRTNL